MRLYAFGRWIWRREDRWELAILLVGVLLRLWLIVTYNPRWGYDYRNHNAYVEWILRYHRPPKIHDLYTAYYPPTYYLLASWIFRAGGGPNTAQLISIFSGIGKLLLLFYGLKLTLPGDRLARGTALALAAVLPCELILDANMSGESLQNLLVMLALVLLIRGLAADGRRRWRYGVWCGLALGAAMSLKVSPLTVAMALGGGALLMATLHPGSAAERLRRGGPLALAALVALAIALPIHGRHRADTGKIFTTAFDTTKIDIGYSERVHKTPYLKRRPLGFFLSPGDGSILVEPHAPTDLQRTWPGDDPTRSRFWPVLVASTFGDYWYYRLSGNLRPGEDAVLVNTKLLSRTTIAFMRWAVLGGMVISLATGIAFLAVAGAALRRRDAGTLTLLLVPALALLAALHFAVEFNIDTLGVVKGHYLMYAAPPLFALFGVAVSWVRGQPRWRPLFLIQMAALFLVAVFTLHCLVHASYRPRKVVTNPVWRL